MNMYNLPLSELIPRVDQLIIGHETLPYRLRNAFKGLVLREEYFTSPHLYSTYLDIMNRYEKIKDLEESTDEHQYIAQSFYGLLEMVIKDNNKEE